MLLASADHVSPLARSAAQPASCLVVIAELQQRAELNRTTYNKRFRTGTTKDQDTKTKP